MREPILFCLCGPSGVGKSTISRALLEQVSSLRLSISATTRSPRTGEQEGVHYYFMTKELFASDLKSGFFLEAAVYNESHYGTPKRNLDEARVEGADLLLDIDVQGATALKAQLGAQVVIIFISAPSFEELRSRLAGRGSENAEVREKRLKRAFEEVHLLANPGLSDFLVINAGIDAAIADISAIFRSERLRLSRQPLEVRRRITTI